MATLFSLWQWSQTWSYCHFEYLAHPILTPVFCVWQCSNKIQCECKEQYLIFWQYSLQHSTLNEKTKLTILVAHTFSSCCFSYPLHIWYFRFHSSSHTCISSKQTVNTLFLFLSTFLHLFCNLKLGVFLPFPNSDERLSTLHKSRFSFQSCCLTWCVFATISSFIWLRMEFDV